MAANKYVTPSKLGTFLAKLSTRFAELTHKHTMSDITNYVVDDTLSSTSTNPIQNKVVDAEFSAIETAMGALEMAIDGKAASSHGHNDVYYTKSETDNAVAQKAQVQIVTWEADD